MIPNTSAYKTLRDKSQEFLDFVVLSCTAVPTLANQIQATGLQGVVRDHFKGASDSAQLLSYAASYQEPLAHMIIITLFSHFEAYVKSMLTEIIAFHGGEKAFQATADRRAKAFVTKSSQAIIDSKRKLQEPAKGAKVGSYQKHSLALIKQGFRFPSELLAPFGVKNLIAKAKPKGSKAFEIPDLLGSALCFPLTPKDELRLNAIREKRNKIAHGKAGKITLKDALGIGKDLRDMAAKVDKHAVEHFFVLEAFA